MTREKIQKKERRRYEKVLQNDIMKACQQTGNIGYQLKALAKGRVYEKGMTVLHELGYYDFDELTEKMKENRNRAVRQAKSLLEKFEEEMGEIR